MQNEVANRIERAQRVSVSDLTVMSGGKYKNRIKIKTPFGTFGSKVELRKGVCALSEQERDDYGFFTTRKRFVAQLTYIYIIDEVSGWEILEA